MVKVILTGVSAAVLAIGILLFGSVVLQQGEPTDNQYIFCLLSFLVAMAAIQISNRVAFTIGIISAVCMVAVISWAWIYMVALHQYGISSAVRVLFGGGAIWLASYSIMIHTVKKVFMHMLWIGIGIGIHAVYRFWGSVPSFRNSDLFIAALVWTVFGIVVLFKDFYSSFSERRQRLIPVELQR